MTEADEKATHDWPRVSPARMLLEAASTGRRARVPAAPNGHGRPVLLVAGFGAPNRSLDRLSTWLRASDWRTYRAPIGINVNCSQRTIDVLIARAEAAHEATGKRLIVIGQSRGGLHARALAGLRPDLMEATIALGSPVLDPLDVRPAVAWQVRTLAKLGSRGVRGLITNDCADGACCEAYRAALSAPPPDGVRAFAIYSPMDEIVSPAACTDPHADCRPVDCSHQMMGMNVAVWREIASILRDQ